MMPSHIYMYRILPLIDGYKWIKIKRFEIADSHPLEYEFAGIINRLSVKFKPQQMEVISHFWFNQDEMIRIFDRFYGAHPETKTDFIIRIDAENKKYELALYRQGLREPVVIPESAYQLIVFKNKFEDYRSENYRQPRGAWIW